MKYAVEAKVFDNGRMVARVRPARDGEESGCTETRSCDVWVDVFDSEMEAIRFCNDYKRGWERTEIQQRQPRCKGGMKMNAEYMAIVDQNREKAIKAMETYWKSMEQAMFANMDLRAVPIKRAAEMLGRSPGTIRKMAAEGKLDRVDNSITVESIHRYLHTGGRTGRSRSGYMRIL